MRDFKTLLTQFKKHLPDADVDIYSDVAEEIALEKRATILVIAILLGCFTFCGALVEELRIHNRNHQISMLKMELSTPTADSASFECVHCGTLNHLRTKNDTIK